MKRLIIVLTALVALTTNANAMSYEQAREQALFLTDKMAYELNLTDDQYEAAYEINLDYLMSVSTYDDLYSTYWTRRNLDLSYILLDWQYRYFCDAAYFYRPLYWDGGFWHFAIYARYPHRDYFYFGRPHFVDVYRGAHSWHHNNDRSWYKGREFGPRRGDNRVGMRDGFNNGHFGRGQRININGAQNGSNSKTFGNGNNMNNRQNSTNMRKGNFGNRQSSTRSTVGNMGNTRSSGTSSFGGGRSSSSDKRESKTGNTFRPSGNSTQNSGASRFGGSRSSIKSTPQSSSSSRNSGIERSNSSTTRSSSSFGGSRSSNSFGSSRSSSSFGSSHGSSSFGGSHSSGSFGGSRSSGGGSNHSGGSSSGGHFGGGRR